ncbi:MAG: hypothetical protein EAS48_01575 [Chryseobacterium sp.]|nr:MAG: hypothetical protein EAS48_01575 [Chryseobacterium sp.]
MEPQVLRKQLTVIPKTEKDIALLKTFFEALELNYSESETEEQLTEVQKQKINAGLEDFRQGRTLSRAEVSQRVRRGLK